jgi:hypothetical protein
LSRLDRPKDGKKYKGKNCEKQFEGGGASKGRRVVVQEVDDGLGRVVQRLLGMLLITLGAAFNTFENIFAI